MTKVYQGTFRKLIAWQSAKELTKLVYKLANKFPKEELYGLASQMKRSAVSVMSNLAEGNQRNGERDRIHFFNIAHSSLTELDNQCELAYELGYITKKDFDDFLEFNNKTGYLIFKLIGSKKNPTSPNNPTSPTSPNKKGFSLIELIITISIIAIMSVGAVVGFRYMGDTLRTREAGGVITDTVKKVELEILKEDYKKSTINFLSNYLVIVSEPEEANLNLEYDGTCLTTTEVSVNLIKKDGEGNLLEATTISDPIDSSVCVGFEGSTETEWQYQIRSNGVSDVIRFVHFNVNRTNPSGITLSGDLSETLTIEAPYAKKTFSTSPITLTVSGEDSSEDLTIQ